MAADGAEAAAWGTTMAVSLAYDSLIALASAPALTLGGGFDAGFAFSIFTMATFATGCSSCSVIVVGWGGSACAVTWVLATVSTIIVVLSGACVKLLVLIIRRSTLLCFSLSVRRAKTTVDTKTTCKVKLGKLVEVANTHMRSLSHSATV